MMARRLLAAAALAAVTGLSAPADVQAQACLQVPTACQVTSAFGTRYNPITGNYSTEFHRGIDFGCPLNTPVAAAAQGVVSVSGTSQTAGNWVVVRSAGSSAAVIKYMHHERNLVSIGTVVNAGQQLALSGNTGRSTGPHLHFQMDVDGAAVDPMPRFCSKPALRPGVLQGEATDVAQTTQPSAPSGGDGTAPAMGLEGSLDEVLGDVIASRALNPDYTRQIGTLSTEKLYAELAYIQAIRLKLQRERSLRRERIEAIQAMIQILLAEQVTKPTLIEQRRAANKAAAASGK